MYRCTVYPFKTVCPSNVQDFHIPYKNETSKLGQKDRASLSQRLKASFIKDFICFLCVQYLASDICRFKELYKIKIRKCIFLFRMTPTFLIHCWSQGPSAESSRPYFLISLTVILAAVLCRPEQCNSSEYAHGRRKASSPWEPWGPPV